MMADDISMNGEDSQAPNLPSLTKVEGRISQLYKTIASLQSQVQTKMVKIQPPEAFNSTQSKL